MIGVGALGVGASSCDHRAQERQHQMVNRTKTFTGPRIAEIKDFRVISVANHLIWIDVLRGSVGPGVFQFDPLIALFSWQ